MEKKESDFIAVDLHVHTPASKCYSLDDGYDTEDAYIKLLKTYREKEIKVIAITDHNTLSGYIDIKNIIDKAKSRVYFWNELNEIEQVKEKINKEKEKIELFNYFTILPGVEFEAYPGIHLLFIFNPDIDITVIEEFIIDNGYPKEVQGNEEVEVSTVSAIDIVKKAYELGAITIAAHVESDKGALKNLPQGLSRAQFFKCKELMGIQVVGLSTIEYIKELYNNKDYRREKLPAFVRCSDYHGNNDEVEKYVTYMKLSSLSFDGIKEAMFNSIECLSFSKNPQNSEIINKLIEDTNTYTLEKLSEKYFKEIKETMCAILNTGQGTILIGVKNKSISGIKKSKEECDEIIKGLINEFDEFRAFFRYKIDYYDFGNHIVSVLKLRSISNHIYSLESKVYIKDDKKIVIANPNQLAKLGEDKFKESFQVINSINKRRIDKINKELNEIKLLEENIGIYKSIVSNSLKFKDVFDIELIDANIKDNESRKLYSLLLGEDEGETYFINSISEPHTSECYLRMTCPRTREYFDSPNKERYLGECILINVGGAVHYIEEKQEYTIVSNIPIIRVLLKDEFKDTYSMKAITVWLKSPILLYIIKLIYGDINVFNPKILSDIPIIMNEIFKKNNEMESIADQIIQSEKLILNYFNQQYTEDIDEDTQNNINLEIKNHNKKIAEIIIKTEELLRKKMVIGENEFEAIKEFIKERKWTYLLN